MEVKVLRKATKCENPEKTCNNPINSATARMIVYKGKPLVLCAQCGPEFQLKKMQSDT